MSWRRSALSVGLVVATIGAMTVAQSPATPDAPSITTAARYGGRGLDTVNAIAVDQHGNIYLAGHTDSSDLPGAERGFQQAPRASGTGFVAKLDRQGRVVWATYLGGNAARLPQRATISTSVESIAIAPDGAVVAGGWTYSSDFPTVNAMSPSPMAPGRGHDGFVVGIAPEGDRLRFGTHVGGADGVTAVGDVAVGPTGQVWAAGTTEARQFVTTSDLSDSPGDGGIFVLAMTVTGQPLWSTRFGGGTYSTPQAIVRDVLGGMDVDGLGHVHVTGTRREAMFAAKLSLSGSRFEWWSPLTQPLGPGADVRGAVPMDLALRPDGTAAIVGRATGAIPLVNAWQSESDRDGSWFVALLDAAGVPTTFSYAGPSSSPARIRAAAGLDGAVHATFPSSSTTMSTVSPIVARHLDGPVFTSADRGDSWHWASWGLEGGVDGIAASGGTVYAATWSGLATSSDNGASWQYLPTRLQRLDGTVDTSALRSRALVADPKRPGVLYADLHGFSRSEDGGRTWRQMRASTAGAGGFSPRVIAISPHDGTIWVGSGPNGVEVTHDGGQTWHVRNRGLPREDEPYRLSPDCLVPHPHRADTFYACGEGLYVTHDSGLSWHRLAESPAWFSPRQLFVHPRNPDVMFAVQLSQLMESDDGGRTWRVALPDQPVRALATDWADPEVMYALLARDDGVHQYVLRSRDRGRRWEPLQAGLTLRRPPDVLLAHPADPVRLFLASTLEPLPYLLRLAPAAAAVQSPRLVPTLGTFLPEGYGGEIAIAGDGSTLIATRDGQYAGDRGRPGVLVLRIAPRP